MSGNHISPYKHVAQNKPIVCLASPGNQVRDVVITRKPIESILELKDRRVADTAIEDPIGGYHHIRGNHMLEVIQGGLDVEDVDWLVIAAPHTSETQGMIGRAQLARMRPSARLVNLGRGALVDERALIEALRERRLAGAALDVFEEEPLPSASPLWSMSECVVTPHVSGLGPRYWERAMEQFTANLRRFVAGEPLANVVDKRAGY